jgi:hypothetical protein
VFDCLSAEQRRCYTLVPDVGYVLAHPDQVRRPLRPFRRPFWLRFTYATSVLVKKY